MSDGPHRFSRLIRIVRSRWVTIPARLVGGIIMVIAASAGSQTVADLFRPHRDQLVSTGALLAYFAAALLVAASVTMAYVVFVRLAERRWPSELQPRAALWELPSGIVLGFGLSAASVTVIWLLGGYQIDGVADRSTWPSLITRGLAIAVASSVIEEILLRGLVLRILAEGLGRWWALAISSLLFGALHLANPHSSVIVALSLAIEAGFMLGVAYLWTERLWMPIGLHGAWNFALAAVFGGALSGTEVSAIIDAKLVGPEWISGGAFGIEGSLLSTIICCTAGLAILVEMLRKPGRARSDLHRVEVAQSKTETEFKAPDDRGAEV
jgi:membrane protease YdiL (CAAX protease family)